MRNLYRGGSWGLGQENRGGRGTGREEGYRSGEGKEMAQIGIPKVRGIGRENKEERIPMKGGGKRE